MRLHVTDVCIPVLSWPVSDIINLAIKQGIITLGARGSSTLVGGIMRDTRGFELGGGEWEEPLVHFYGFSDRTAPITMLNSVK
jgi:hypothetical protein